MKIDAVSYLGSHPLVDNYHQQTHPVHSLFSYHPMEEGSFARRAKYLDSGQERYDRAQLARILHSYHKPELLHPNVVHNLNRLGQAESIVVIGGQQAGLLGGPLYTLYKAITIIQLARREEERLKRPVIPVFWIAGEDHDRNEVDHVWVQSGDGTPVKHRFSTKDDKKRSISSLLLEEKEFHRWLDELSQILPDRENKKKWLEKLKVLSAGSVSWSRFFARVMHHLFGKWGLLLIDSAYPPLRRLEAPFFQALIEKSEKIHLRVQEATGHLNQLGYPSPVDLKENQGHLFIQQDGERLPLFRDHGQWVTGEGKARFTTNELLLLAGKSPELFSNNVVTRPLMQEYLFPTLAFVGGPGEIAYWALFKHAFQEVGLEMPIVYPRLHLTLINRTVRKRMDEFQLSWSDLFSRLEQKRDEWLKNQHSLDLDALFLPVKQQVMEIYQPLISTLTQKIGMDLNVMGKKNQKKILEQVDFFYAYTKKAIENKYQTRLKHWDEIFNSCTPFHKPQERVYNFVNLWNEYGLEWVDQLLQASLLAKGEETKHRCIIL
ncbi:bacillithiol biosynthesis cysteine-adding enzyme BshC [Paenactinomyces guangxiensis]|uniref:Putative cysteine ligase BshC n=1 Tax=Paenactinomyces guangxiensis TaxID=1490290 RepID=A0A7W1WQL7_9BACL|nr:bacillithiol biosynthesis cysteine-adding enzyme BshC [Paenactinomyces guangxiensis]MBA4494258.1 bacillithiol biosynthesis cysteine-adding enzyme BshC [Paenactinomyces guangxiensis]MBH8590754.1 bacillithiol biosynthesis cysteine-adding enzyme BshC [Paenactinomyces guangxiensis]